MAVYGTLGGHRLIDNSLPPGKLQNSAMIEVLDQVALIFPLEKKSITATNAQSTFTVSDSTAPSAGLLTNGIVDGSIETTKEYANVGILNAVGEPIIGPNGRNVWGRVTGVVGAGPYSYTVTVYDADDQTTASPTPVNWNTSSMGTTIGIVELPIRKKLSSLSQTDLRNRFVGLASTERDQETVEDIKELFQKSGIVEGATINYANNRYILDGDTLKAAIDKIDQQLFTTTNNSNTAEANLQTELDTTQTGAGLNTNGTYSPNAGSNYIAAATSLKDADNKLDQKAKDLQDELNTTQAAAGLNADGTYTANGSSNYLTTATGLKDADNKLDAKAKALQDELDATQNGAGLGTTGTYSADPSTIYLTTATSLKDADKKLDTTVKAHKDELDATQAGAGLNANGTYSADATTNYLQAASSLKDADKKLDTKAKALQDELDATQSAAGINTNGTYTAPVGTNYLSGATTLKGADVLLDTQVKSVADRATALEAYKTSEGVFIDQETPTGTISQGNLVFTLANSPKANSLRLFAYGLALVQGTHYTISGNTITYVSGYEPVSGETHRASYRY